jgi:hypothetical protein
MNVPVTFIVEARQSLARFSAQQKITDRNLLQFIRARLDKETEQVAKLAMLAGMMAHLRNDRGDRKAARLSIALLEAYAHQLGLHVCIHPGAQPAAQPTPLQL